MLCALISHISGETYSLKSTSIDRFYEKLFMAILFTLRFFTRNLLGGNRWRNTFHILFWYLAWGWKPGITSNKPTHYVLDYGDFLRISKILYYIKHKSHILYISSHTRYNDIFFLIQSNQTKMQNVTPVTSLVTPVTFVINLKKAILHIGFYANIFKGIERNQINFMLITVRNSFAKFSLFFLF